MNEKASDTTSWRGDLHMDRLVTKNNTVSVNVEADRLVLDGPLGYHFVLPRAEVTEISQAIVGFWKWSWPLKNGIRIYHAVSGVPQKLVFVQTKVFGLSRSAQHQDASVFLELRAPAFPLPRRLCEEMTRHPQYHYCSNHCPYSGVSLQSRASIVDDGQAIANDYLGSPRSHETR